MNEYTQGMPAEFLSARLGARRKVLLHPGSTLPWRVLVEEVRWLLQSADQDLRPPLLDAARYFAGYDLVPAGLAMARTGSSQAVERVLAGWRVAGVGLSLDGRPDAFFDSVFSRLSRDGAPEPLRAWGRMLMEHHNRLVRAKRRAYGAEPLSLDPGTSRAPLQGGDSASADPGRVERQGMLAIARRLRWFRFPPDPLGLALEHLWLLFVAVRLNPARGGEK